MWLIIGGEAEDPGDLELTVKGDRGTLVGQNDHVHVKGVRKEKVDGDQSLTVGGQQQEKVGTNHALEAGQEIHLKGGMKVIIEAGMELTLKAAGGFVKIDPSGVYINGTMVYINSGGAPGSGSGSSPAPPEDAHEGGPHDPTPADSSKSGFKSSSS
jgi:type VI secretion system secreted protein VgrG